MILTRRNFFKAAGATALSIPLLGYSDGIFAATSQQFVLQETFKFGVFSDPHFYDTKLGTSKALDDYIAKDRKLIKESEAILKETIYKLIEEDPPFVIIPGDLTKDGEVHNHIRFAEYLSLLKLHGIKVYVVPGNHDINNPHSYSYTGSVPTSISSATPQDFINIYYDYGYKDAISRDPNSLSYIVEPADGIWLFAIDTCVYDNNYTLGHSYTGGRIKQETWDWIQKNIRQAKAHHKFMIGMFHHGILEHFTGQSQFFSEYVLEDWKDTSKLFAESGIGVIFTGHFHSHDTSMQKWVDPTFLNESYLYDIETGSLVTYPSPYRIVEVDKYAVMRVKSSNIKTIDYNLGSKTFPEHSKEFLAAGLKNIAYTTVTAPVSMGGFGLNPNDPTTGLIVDMIAAGFLAHYQGDEKPDATTLATISAFLKNPDPTVQVLGQTLYSLWTDVKPSDWTFSFMMENGTLLTKKKLCSTIPNIVNSKRPDDDNFIFQGKHGDVVTIYVDPNSSGKYIAGGIKAQLKDQIKGYNLDICETKTPSFYFTTRLGATGAYNLKISEETGNPFSGDYCVTIEALDETSKTLQATGDVE